MALMGYDITLSFLDLMISLMTLYAIHIQTKFYVLKNFYHETVQVFDILFYYLLKFKHLSHLGIKTLPQTFKI